MNRIARAAVAVPLVLACSMACQAAGALSNQGAAGATTEQRNVLGQIEIDKPLVWKYTSWPTASTPKFIEVEVSNVENPGNRTVSVGLFYRPASGPDRRIGSFSTFPPSKPGTFLVAVPPNLPESGSIVISLADPADSRKDPILVTVRTVAFKSTR